ncbi:tumor necrosis factor receptor superfamily member 11B [Anolis carolinensis]|uniref:TNF receptor superfamily member 11b n=1 Tax=Anolis carolinensis TaxID=28377 RepID=H9GDW3_ANOCA|nr:PREDICTED: tumor necrosis factor receptor superfamily member 11B [Anolis carolinensis]|eukprot:XP_003224876.1 PREDICTED: tumor necrosis factor receptor superfamily member 11B [Anolis carolinensis]
MNKFLYCTLVLLDISVKWTIQEAPSLKFPHYDPMTSRQLMCDQCPPGTYVKQNCTASSKTKCSPCPDQYYADDWNSNEECQYCNVVCNELQYEKVECSSTKNRICECVEGRYLELEFCLKHTACPPGFGVVQQGTPERNTVCESCPEGYFSNETSSKAACREHTNCSALGLKMAKKGNATCDNVCQEERTDKSDQQCEIDITLCEEAFFRFAAPTKVPPGWLDTLKDSLPGIKVSAEIVERIKQRHSSQEQTFQLLKLWKQKNKDHKNVIRGMDLCENSVLKQIGHLNITSEQLGILMENLPGKKVGKEETEHTLRMCKSRDQFLKLLNLWRIKNRDQDTIKGLTYGLKHLKAYHFPKTTIQGLRKVVKYLHSLTMYKLYQKLLLEMLGNQIPLVKVRRG